MQGVSKERERPGSEHAHKLLSDVLKVWSRVVVEGTVEEQQYEAFKEPD